MIVYDPDAAPPEVTPDTRKTFIVTFGSGQLFGFGLKYHLVVIAPDELTARYILNEQFGRQWSMIYAMPTDYVEKYHTRELGVIDADDRYSFTHIVRAER